MKLFRRLAALVLGAAVAASAVQITAFAEDEAPARGYAEYFFYVPDEEELYDDDALRDIGFDDNDIDCLKRGLDVVYKGQFAPYDYASYADIPGDDPLKELIGSYGEENGIDLSFTSFAVLTASRTRGDEEPEEDIDVDFQATLLLDDTEEAALPPDRGRLYYIDAENSAVTEIASEYVFSEKYSHMTVEARLTQKGLYMLAAVAAGDEDSQDSSDTEDPQDSSEAESSEDAPVTSGSDDTNPATGKALPAAVMIAALALVIFAVKRRK